MLFTSVLHYGTVKCMMRNELGQFTPNGDPSKSGHWKGGRIKRGEYWYIKTFNHPKAGKQGYVAEHRLVMEKRLGRYLEKGEIIHHINKDCSDNRIENLELFSSPGKHTSKAHPEIYEKQKKLFKGKRFSPKTEFKKGQVPWNKKL